MKIGALEIRDSIVQVNPEPSCITCGVGVVRPKCMWELNPRECPRHEQRSEWETDLKTEELAARQSNVGDIPLHNQRRW